MITFVYAGQCCWQTSERATDVDGLGKCSGRRQLGGGSPEVPPCARYEGEWRPWSGKDRERVVA
jgi:hypothetical protein